MPRFCTVIGVLLVAALLISPLVDATAAIKVKTIGRSLNQLTPPIKGATAPAWNIATGLRAVGVQSRTYFKADTLGSGAVGTPSWTVAVKPAGSAVAAMDSADGKWINSFKPDVTGQYVVSATVGGQTASDTIFASTYTGVGTDAQAGCMCHMMATPSTPSTSTAIKTAWSTSVHATVFKNNITGVEPAEQERGMGQYRATCMPCHTSGYDKTAANNNFAVQTVTSGWDTTWYKGLELYNGAYWMNIGDTTVWNMLGANEKMVATIGCEQCHGPAADHKMTANKMAIGQTLDPGVCNQCHDGSRRHSLGTFYDESMHNEVEYGAAAEGGRATCQPCHTGKGMMYYLNHNQDTTGLAATWVASRDAKTPISCQVCHDPHGNDNPYALRTMGLKGDTLKNGYLIPAQFRSNTGNICMNCHGGRYSVKYKLTNVAPYYGWSDRFYAHYNIQGDMFFGSGGYESVTLGQAPFSGVMSHGGVEGTCAGCHMQPRKNRLDGGGNMLANHSFSMKDTLFATGVYKPTDVCAKCHGEIESFEDIQAGYDYDRNGQIEGVQTEIHGLLEVLKARLPIDSTTMEPVNSRKDSLKVKNRPDLIRGIWNYYFVKYDRSYGVHNTKYAVALLYNSIGWTPLSVKNVPGVLPTDFALDQNYPNPFNPSTTIRFSLPQEHRVNLVVYDMTGAVVKTVLNDMLGAGYKEVQWDGTNNSGAKVATGMYIYRLEAGNFTATKKMLLLK
jgi:hypothetical protein